MSKMGEAALWVRENGLENDPNALTKYLEWKYNVNNKTEDGNRERNTTKEREHSENSSGSRPSES